MKKGKSKQANMHSTFSRLAKQSECYIHLRPSLTLSFPRTSGLQALVLVAAIREIKWPRVILQAAPLQSTAASAGMQLPRSRNGNERVVCLRSALNSRGGRSVNDECSQQNVVQLQTLEGDTAFIEQFNSGRKAEESSRDVVQPEAAYYSAPNAIHDLYWPCRDCMRVSQIR
jgi:hypothetical protein